MMMNLAPNSPKSRLRLARACLTYPELKAYLDAALAYPDLTWDQERALGRRGQAGDKQARQRLVECNQRLVVSIAKRYCAPDAHDLLDLIGEGNVGLCLAVDKYDPARRARFGTHATWWIRREIGRAAVAEGIPGGVHVPYERARTAAPSSTLRHATVSLDDALAAEHPAVLAMPAPMPASPSPSLSWSRSTAAAPSAPAADPLTLLRQGIATLPPAAREVLVWRFGLDGEQLSLSETATRTGRSVSAVRRLEIRALHHLRAVFGLPAGGASTARLLTAFQGVLLSA